MASIANDPNGRRRILFIGADGKRRTIRLGKMSKKSAETVRGKIEDIVSCQITGQAPSRSTSEWIAGLESVLADKLVRAGLIRPRGGVPTLGEFIDQYIDERKDVKQSTLTVFGHTRRNLIEFFGRNRRLDEINAGQADRWRNLHLIGTEKLASNTVRRRCGIAKQFFRAAVRQKLIEENPFADLVSTVTANASRFYFVTREEAEKVIDACPDTQWRLLFALSRYGGLRCPSEHLALTWDDVLWDQDKIRVPSPKTEHHEGKAFRFVPIFPELRPHLEQAFDEAPKGTLHVITRYRDSNANLRTQLERIITRAGLKPWPKLFQNLRSTRETELVQDFPLHVVCSWIGNNPAVAAKHYLQVTDEHFQQAAQNPAQQIAAHEELAGSNK